MTYRYCYPSNGSFNIIYLTDSVGNLIVSGWLLLADIYINQSKNDQATSVLRTILQHNAVRICFTNLLAWLLKSHYNIRLSHLCGKISRRMYSGFYYCNVLLDYLFERAVERSEICVSIRAIFWDIANIVSLISFFEEGFSNRLRKQII